MAAATIVIDWKSAATKPLLVVKTDPESISVGDSFKVKLFSAYPYDLKSPYDGIGSKKTEASKPITETVELSGSSDINTQYPIKSVLSIKSLLPIIDELKQEAVVAAGDSARSLIKVVNQQLKLTDATLKLHGSIEVSYETFEAQVWKHNAFAKAGKALLFAKNKTTADVENVPLSISERALQSVSFKIEPYERNGAFSLDNYAWFIVYPTDKNCLLTVDHGAITRQGDVSDKIEKERINFSGTEANASFLIEKLVTFTGYFFDGKGKVIRPKFRVGKGILKSDMPCYGTGFLTYFATGTVYSYAIEKTYKEFIAGGLFPIRQLEIQRGTVFLFEKDKIGISLTYDIPDMQAQQHVEPVEFFRIYSEYVVQDKKTFELPPNFPDDNTFPSNPAGDLPDKDTPSIVLERTHFLGNLFTGGGIDTQFYSQVWLSPFAGEADNPDIVYKIRENIPADADEYAKQTMEDKIKQAKEEYGIP
jgi:hypothetical protein